VTPALTRRAVLASAGATAFAANGAASAATDSLNAVFEAAFERQLDLSPNLRSTRGLAGDQSRWTMPDARWSRAVADLATRTLTEARAVGAHTRSDRLSIDLFAVEAELAQGRERWRDHTYPFAPWSAPFATLTSILTDYHQIEDLEGAEDYVKRVRRAGALILLQSGEMRARVASGTPPPAFSFARYAQDARNFASGAPFGSGTDHLLMARFKTGIASLDLTASARDALVADLRSALLQLAPLAQSFADEMSTLGSTVSQDRGVWALPDGAEFYRFCILEHTSLSLDPDSLHEFGFAEMARLQGELQNVATQVGFDGSLTAFLHFLRSDPRFFEVPTASGRLALLERSTAFIAGVQTALPQLFTSIPKAQVEVRPVPPSLESSQGRAYYVESGSRPGRVGTYYLNLGRPEALPCHQLQAIAYHEAIPGHHMQQALAAERTDLPRFRRFLAHNAFNEGWALYAESLPREIGLYTDLYAVAGQLSMELFRAARIVVDTGIHHKRWTLYQAKTYLDANLANAPSDNAFEAERYFNWPGQALGYQVGLNHIRQLRARAAEALGSHFDRRTFHDAVLGSGSLTLPLLEREITAFIGSQESVLA